MKFYLGVTDNGWYNYLRNINPEDINFWQPGGKSRFKVLEKGAPFLFKLKYPINAIGGVGFFSSHSLLPMNFAWEVFGNRNGCDTLNQFQNLIFQYRTDKDNINPQIGCIILTQPIFFKKEDWIEIPADWSKSIVQGKSYESESLIGKSLWSKIENLLEKYLQPALPVNYESQLMQEPKAWYGKSILTKVRLGQGAFRILVTDAYTRRCSITGERTLPVLEAAHIKPFAVAGPHAVSNGLLLRSDVHKLFDTGYLTITNDYKTEVSRRIREEYENGKEYYQFHGKSLMYLPEEIVNRPGKEFIQWHNEKVYRG